MKHFILSLLGLFAFSTTSHSQANIYTHGFTNGATGFTLNSTSNNSVANAENYWVVNNVYNGGSASFMCMGFPLSFSVAPTPFQPASIANSPNGNYLHITSQVATNNGITNANFVAADGFCIFGGENSFAMMSNDISTVGYDSISLGLWWMCGGSVSHYGGVYYSTDMGVTWSPVVCPTNSTFQWRGQTNWLQSYVTNPAWDGQATLRFGFRFDTGTSSNGEVDPSFSIDDISIRGFTACSNTTSSISPTSCLSYTSPSGNVWTQSGNYLDTIANTAGCDSIISISLTVNQVNVGITANGAQLSANAAGATYNWINCSNNQSTGNTQQTFTPAQSGSYAVVVTENGCSDTSACQQVNISNVGLTSNELTAVNVFPNPFQNQLTIDFGKSTDATIQLTNSLGQVVYNKSLINKDKVVLELDLPKGIYFMDIRIGQEKVLHRVVKR